MYNGCSPDRRYQCKGYYTARLAQCGAVVTAAVILDPNRPILGLNDSKKLTEARREKLLTEFAKRPSAGISPGRGRGNRRVEHPACHDAGHAARRRGPAYHPGSDDRRESLPEAGDAGRSGGQG